MDSLQFSNFMERSVFAFPLHHPLLTSLHPSRVLLKQYIGIIHILRNYQGGGGFGMITLM